MKTSKTLKRVMTAIAHPQLLATKGRYLFVLSHMRSRSSLLSHVLGSNPEICGYSELQIKYRTQFDLLKMRLDLYARGSGEQRGKYLHDKILHNRMVISDNILNTVHPKIVILVREPVATLKSIINMSVITGKVRYADQDRMVAYYCERLEDLGQYASKLKGDFFFLDSDDLIVDTEHTLSELSSWLGLEVMLDKHYTSFEGTGKAGYGDPSTNISSGVVTRTREHAGIELRDDIVATACVAYEKSKAELSRYRKSMS